MKRALVPLLIFSLLVTTGCAGMFGNLTGSSTRSARDNAAKALETTIDLIDALMTLAGSSRDLGVWGPPGTPHADDVWSKISAQSITIHKGLKAWRDALVAGEATGPYETIVRTAIAILTALMPPKLVSAMEVRPVATMANLIILIDRFGTPDLFCGYQSNLLAVQS